MGCSSVIRRKWREGESSPYTGKLSARPAGKPGDFLIAKEGLRRSPPRHFLGSTAKHTERSVCVLRHGGIYRSDVARPRPNPERDQPPPAGRPRDPGKRTRREDHALLIVRDEFRPAIP